jgi:parallel beta-helix repeat protein
MKETYMKLMRTLPVSMILVLIGVLTFSVSVWPARSEPKTWIVDDDGSADFHTIQEAIGAASSGDIILVYNGTYYGSVAVGSFTLMGQSRAGTFIDGNGTAGPVVSLSTRATVSGFTIRNGDYGIEASSNSVLLTYTGNVIDNNNVVDNRYGGIHLHSVGGNDIANNLIANNSLFGVHLDTAGNNTVINNTVVGNGQGIDFYGFCNDNILRSNNLTDNRYNFGIILRGETDAFLFPPTTNLVNNVDTSNTVDGKPIYYLVNQSGVRVPSDAGCILLNYCSNITIEGCSLTGNLQGISLFSTNNALITNNSIADNAYGIHAIGLSSNNTIVGNNLKDNSNGIYLDGGSSLTTMRNNSITGGYMNFGIYPEVPKLFRTQDLLNDIDSSNTVDGKPIIYWSDQHDRQVPINAGYVVLLNSTNVLIEGLNLRNNVQSVLVLASNNTVIANSSIANSVYGIDVRGFRWQYNSSQSPIDYISFNTTVRGNVLTDNGVGIRFNDYAGTISDNIIRRNPLGVHLRDAYGSTVSGNIVVASELVAEGIYAHGIFDDPEPIWDRSQELFAFETGGIVAGGILNSIQNNTIMNSFVGISLYDSFSTTSSRFSTVFHNNLINNTHQAMASPYDGNYWDAAYPSGGNYWSDYNGTDLRRGPYQNQTGSDGIGDEHYEIISAYDVSDRYPLMNPYIFGDLNHDAKVNVLDIAVVARAFGCKPGDSYWNPVADMDLNEVVNIVDISKVAREFGKEWRGYT